MHKRTKMLKIVKKPCFLKNKKRWKNKMIKNIRLKKKFKKVKLVQWTLMTIQIYNQIKIT